VLNEFLKKSIAFGLFFFNLPPTIMIPIPTKNIIKPNPLGIKSTSACEKKTNALIITGMQIAINAPTRIKRVLRFNYSFLHHLYRTVHLLDTNQIESMEKDRTR